MKKTFLFITIFILILCSSCSRTDKNSITVYCYNSFAGDWGPGKEIIDGFEKETGIHVNLISCSGSVQMYSKILYEGSKCPADVVIGLPDSIIIDTSLFLSWIPECKNELIPYEGNELIPFNYGIFAFICDTENKDINVPQSISDLTKPEYKNKYIIIDPRTSSVGLGLLKWSYYALGSDFTDWWTKVMANALTVADSWSSGYGLFTEGEAPLVISYSTSPVYHLIYDKTDRYKALSFADGHIKTTEYLAIMKNSSKTEAAKKFCEYVLTKGQKAIALCNTMFPANTETELPEEYKSLISPEILNVNDIEFIAKQDELLKTWTEIAAK